MDFTLKRDRLQEREVKMKKKLAMLIFSMLATVSLIGSSLVYAAETNVLSERNSTFELEYYVRIDSISGVANVVFASGELIEPIIINNPVTGLSEIVEIDASTMDTGLDQRNMTVPGGIVQLRGAITGTVTCWVSVHNVSVGVVRNPRLHVRGHSDSGLTSFNSTNPPRSLPGGLGRGGTWREEYRAVFPALASVNVVLEASDDRGPFVMSGTIRR
jgi:hypothetical protein